VLPKHFWESRDLSKTTLDIPLGSGAYKIKEVDRGRSIIYERVADWWAKDLPVSKGQWNFDEIRYDYFGDRNVAFEQFKVGSIDYWYENSAKAWATEFEFPAIRRGLVKIDRVEQHRPTPMQAFAINQRRPQFEDIRVRKALNLAFNFEEMNEQLLYSAYFRTSSYFANSKMTPRGLPEGDELKLLEEAKKIAADGVPPEVFTTEFKQPTGGQSSVHRRNLAEATKLLREAGYTVVGTQLRNAKGQPLKIEVLLNSPTFDRHTQNYAADLRKLGIEMNVRVVDPAQYQQRVLKFDFDMILHVVSQSSVPGNEQRLYWSSEGADRDGSRNVMGIKNKAVDFLVEKIVFAKGQDDLVAATRALDRVLMANHYVVAQWHYLYDRMAYWDKFGRPAKLPSIMPGFTFDQIWWFDEARAAALAEKRAKP
jgi:microcin C transport system substrate-binding protein